MTWTLYDPNATEQSEYDGTNVVGQSIRIFRTDGTVERDITVPIDDQPYVPDPGAVWSPDGTRIAWIQRLGQLQIVVAAADGSQQVVVFPTRGLPLVRGQPLEAYELSWSPDGRSLLVTAIAGSFPPFSCVPGRGAYTLLLVAADGSSPPIWLATDVGSWCTSDIPRASWQAVYT